MKEKSAGFRAAVLVLVLMALLLAAGIGGLAFLDAQEARISALREEQAAREAEKALLAALFDEETERQLGKAEPEPLRFQLKYADHLIPFPYIYQYRGQNRPFEFSMMLRKLAVVEAEFERGPLIFADNYKDRNGAAPRYRGNTADRDGTLRGAAVPAYPDPGNREEFDYLPDGTLVRLIDPRLTGLLSRDGAGLSGDAALRFSEMGPWEPVQVYSILDRREYFIPKKYLGVVRGGEGAGALRTLRQVKKCIAVDVANQTLAAFEKAGELPGWTIVSYGKCTTGMLGPYHQPTPVGYFYAVESKPYFEFVYDGTNIIQGRAPYAVRFTAGAYVHGLPWNAESVPTLGTVPLSHKCVRNYTSHAKFLYEWYEADQTVVIVIDGNGA